MKILSVSTIVLLVIDVNTLSDQANKQQNDTGDEERWIWGYVDVTENKPEPNRAPVSEKVEDNPCKRELPPMPNYKAPGKRIAEQKCEEYIWAVNKRVEGNKLSAACDEYRKKHGIIVGGSAAVGGRDALPGEYPHMGAIGWKAVTGTYIFKCGSILISPNYVVTAAHCTKADERDTEIADVIPKVIRFGDKNIKDQKNNNFFSKQGEISRIIVNPNYNSPKKYNDIALMQLPFNLFFDKNVQPACLWHRFDTTSLGIKATATGWGVVKASSHETSPVLQVVDLDIIDSKTCDALLRPNCNRLWCGIQDTQICAGILRGGVDSCQGDSGGPLQVKIPLPNTSEGTMHYVIGITSFGFGCALENTPGVYTRVSAYLDWIESYVWKDV